MNFVIISLFAFIYFFSWLFNYSLLKYYQDQHESFWLASAIATYGLSSILMYICLVPLDVYTASLNLSSMFVIFDRPVATYDLYYGIYVTLILSCFIFIPFAYFYAEERIDELTFRDLDEADLEDTAFPAFPALPASAGPLRPPSPGAEKAHAKQPLVTDRLVRSVQSTLIFAFVLLIITFAAFLMSVIDFSKDAYIRELLEGLFDDNAHYGEGYLRFFFSMFFLVGGLGKAYYTSYGLASLPFFLIRGTRSLDEERVDISRSIARSREAYRNI